MSADGDAPRPVSAGAWVATAALVALAAGGLALAFVSRDLPPDSDESHHILLGLRYQRDVAAGDATAFVRHTVKTGRYPFAHGWAVAAAYGLTGGPSLFAARVTSALSLAAAVLFALLLLRRLRPHTHPLWGVWLGAALALAPETFQNAVICMLEVPGLALALMAVWAYHRFVERPGVLRGLVTAFAVTALLFVKYPYGAYLYVPICVHELLRVRGRVRELFRAPSLAVWVPTAAMLAIWLIVPPARASIVRLLGDAPDAFVTDAGRDPGALPSIQPELGAFYAKALVGRLSASWTVGVALAIGFVVMVLRGGAFVRVVVAGSVVWTVFTLTLSFRTSGWERFLVPLAGSFAVLGAAGFADAFDWARRHRRGLWPAIARSFVVLLLAAGIGEAAIVRWPKLGAWADAAVETTGAERDAVAFLAGAVEGPANVLLIGGWDQLNEGAVHVQHLLQHPDAAYEEVDVKAVRRGKGYSGAERLGRWFDQESRWHPEGETGRRRYVVTIQPAGEQLAKIEAHVPEAARAEYDRVWADLDAETARRLEGAERLDERTDALATYRVYRLDDVASGVE